MRLQTPATLVFAALLATASFVSAADIPGSVLDPYLQVQTALAGDSLSGAHTAARALSAQAAKAGPALKAVIAPADKIAAAADIKAARTAFGELSDAMIGIAGAGTGGKGVRVAYCSMVKKSWLQKDGEIANPYYGSAMLRCGEFTK
jgi:Cu(I)/Ag(I) efflux system membrane fusion protein